ncbi:MAG: Cation efflux system protein CusB [Verrucomicrobiae bacterium]|nr:Cation efflux system protein CusB [Verrucomicrobiae bacterium]
MKTLIAVVTLLSATFLTGCSKSHEHPPAAQTYWCPMHPEVTSTDSNAQCDKCGGMKLLPKEPDAKPVTAAPAPKGAKYFCPMHPQITSNKRGTCPICNMDLVPAGQDEHAGHSMVSGLASVKVNPEVRQRIGLKTGTVASRNLSREIRAAARVVPAETGLQRVTARVEGWTEKVFVTTGQAVKAGDPLLEVYSPELLAAQREVAVAGDTAKRRLELLGFDGNTLRAPISGYVIERNIQPGQRIMPNEPLVVIADLATVWAEVELFQSDLAAVAVGMPAELTIGGKSFTGQVALVSPTLDPMTRTAKARLEFPNPALLLKPEMLATATIGVPLGKSLAIPIAAVMRTGEKTYAFRDEGEGKLMPVVVELGARSGEWFQLAAGLNEGDAVVVSANFLVDSESQLKAALSGMGGHQH